MFAVGSAVFTMGSIGANQAYSGGTGPEAGIDVVTFSVGSTRVETNEQNDIVVSRVGGAMTGTLNGGSGFDILSLANGDDLSGITGAQAVTNFDDLQLANNASVKMTAAQYNQFATSTQALGTNTVTLDTMTAGIEGKALFADIESWIILDGLGFPDGKSSAYTITGDNQSVIDLYSSIFNIGMPTIAGGLTGVSLLADGGGAFNVSARSGGTDHSIRIPGGESGERSVVNLGGVHTGLLVEFGASGDLLRIEGAAIVSGMLEGGDGFDFLSFAEGGGGDISGATVSGFDVLDFADSSVTMSAATWDQFVATNGLDTPGHIINSSPSSVEAVTLTTTTPDVTTAYYLTENYVLSSAADDFLRVTTKSRYLPAKVDLSGGGSDLVVLNDNGDTGFFVNSPGVDPHDLHTTLIHFTGGAGGDILQIQKDGVAISSASGFKSVAAANTSIESGKTTVVYTSGLAAMDDTWTEAEAQTALDTALGTGTIATGSYTFVSNFTGGGGGAYVMGVEVINADTLANAEIDLMGVLSGTSAGALTSVNFL